MAKVTSDDIDVEKVREEFPLDYRICAHGTLKDLIDTAISAVTKMVIADCDVWNVSMLEIMHHIFANYMMAKTLSIIPDAVRESDTAYKAAASMIADNVDGYLSHKEREAIMMMAVHEKYVADQINGPMREAVNASVESQGAQYH